jgi:small nuclear ribonucleoprotein G
MEVCGELAGLKGNQGDWCDGARLTPEFMDRKLYLHLQAGREVSGVLRGFDMFLNLVVENAFEELGGGVRKPLGMIVSWSGSTCHI